MSSRRPLKVLYVAHVGASGGAGRSLRFLIENFPPGSVEAHVIVPPGMMGDEFAAAGATVYSIPGISTIASTEGIPLTGIRWIVFGRELWNLRHGRQLKKLMHEIQPDLVHLNERGMFQAAAIAHRLEFPIVMHARSIADTRNPLVNRLEKRYSPRIDRILCIDECVRRSLPSSPPKEVVYNPLPFRSSTSTPASNPRSHVVVTFLAGLMVYKGVWDLVEAAKRLRHRPDIVFNLYGGNVRPPQFYRTLTGRICTKLGLTTNLEKDVREWIVREGLGSTVRLLGNVRPDEALFNGTDILTFPSHLNGIGRSVFEAGMFGIPSIVTMDEPIEDIVQHEATGLIAPPKNPAALADAILRLADNPDLRQRLGATAKSRYLSQFSPQRLAAQVLQVYNELLSEKAVMARPSTRAA